MERVMCALCHEKGYTASSDLVRCECGGIFIILKRRTIENENQ